MSRHLGSGHRSCDTSAMYSLEQQRPQMDLLSTQDGLLTGPGHLPFPAFYLCRWALEPKPCQK